MGLVITKRHADGSSMVVAPLGLSAEAVGHHCHFSLGAHNCEADAGSPTASPTAGVDLAK